MIFTNKFTKYHILNTCLWEILTEINIFACLICVEFFTLVKQLFSVLTEQMWPLSDARVTWYFVSRGIPTSRSPCYGKGYQFSTGERKLIELRPHNR